MATAQTAPLLDPLGEPEPGPLRVRRCELGTRCAVCERAQGAGMMPDGRMACTACAERKGVPLAIRRAA